MTDSPPNTESDDDTDSDTLSRRALLATGVSAAVVSGAGTAIADGCCEPNPTNPDDCLMRDLPVGCQFSWFRNWKPWICHCPGAVYGGGYYGRGAYGGCT